MCLKGQMRELPLLEICLCKQVNHTFWCRKVNHISVLLKEIHLLNCLDWLDIELFQGPLQLAVVCPGAPGHFLHLPPGRTLAAVGFRDWDMRWRRNSYPEKVRTLEWEMEIESTYQYERTLAIWQALRYPFFTIFRQSVRELSRLRELKANDYEFIRDCLPFVVTCWHGSKVIQDQKLL